jgi:signal transduction histidine kinase
LSAAASEPAGEGRAQRPVVDAAAAPDAASIVEVAHVLADTGLHGVLWLDGGLAVRRKLGSLCDFVETGTHVTSSMFALVGQEARMLALREARGTVFHLPDIAMMSAEGEMPRMNISIFWLEPQQSYIVLISRVLANEMRDAALEDEIRKRRIADAALARINQQLEEFAYVISHDLKAPLRALRYFAGDVTAALDKDPVDTGAARRAAGEMTTTARRMSHMMVGLLEYSRIGRQLEAAEVVDTAALVAEIVQGLRSPPGIAIEVVGDWPRFRTVAAPLDVVLRNLIENAIKHHDRERGRITVSATPGEANWIFSIADDGRGIAPEWHEAIFEPFRKVDDAHHPESSGIGLALVKRTVETVGGRIEVRSDPARARGTTFRVHWPKRLSA